MQTWAILHMTHGLGFCFCIFYLTRANLFAIWQAFCVSCILYVFYSSGYFGIVCHLLSAVSSTLTLDAAYSVVHCFWNWCLHLVFSQFPRLLGPVRSPGCRPGAFPGRKAYKVTKSGFSFFICVTSSFCLLLLVWFCCVRFSFVSTKRNDWLRKRSLKWPVFSYQ